MGRKVDWCKGIIVSLITPWDNNEELDEQALRRQIDFLIEKGVHGLFPLSTTGEFFKQSMEERKKVIEIAIDQTKGRVPVLPGCHTLSTKWSIELAKHCKEMGANGITLLHPYGMFPLGEESLYNHYKDVNEATDLPIAVYTEGHITNDMSFDLMSRIADLPNIMGIKLSTTDMERFGHGVQKLSDRIAVLTGMEVLYVPVIMLGGVGGFLGTSNMIPEYWVKVHDLATAGNLKEANDMMVKFNNLAIDLIGKYGFSETIKEGCNIRGLNVGQTRRPRGWGDIKPITTEGREEIRKMLVEIRIPL